MVWVEDIFQEMMRRFEVTDKNVKEMKSDLFLIGKKMNAHVVSIKHLEFQMNQLFTTLNPHQPITLLINTIQNPKNDGRSMVVTTKGGKTTIDQPIPFVVQGDMTKKDEVEEYSGELIDVTTKEVELSQKVLPITRP